MGAVMVAGFVSAGVLAAAGVVLVLTAPSSRTPCPSRARRAGASVGCVVTF
ncbi:MAG: hypothetical protein U0325_12115 [Polyangiales bacterium]